MPTPTVYRSDDASAPTLSGSGSDRLVGVLDACLVTGYGSKTAAGWTKPYTGTNKAAFRQGGGLQRYLRIDDSLSSYQTRAVTYDSMTDVDTGTGQMPLNAVVSGGHYIRRSVTADTTVRPWMVIATDTVVHVFIYSAAQHFQGAEGLITYSFGDLASPLMSGDTGRSFVVGATATSDTATTYDNGRTPLFQMETTSDSSRTFLRTAVALTGDAISAGKWPLCGDNFGTTSGQTWVSQQWSEPVYPVVTGGVRLARVGVASISGTVLRGFVPGAFYVGQSGLLLNARNLSTFYGKRGTPHENRQFMLINAYGNTTTWGTIAMELTAQAW